MLQDCQGTAVASSAESVYLRVSFSDEVVHQNIRDDAQVRPLLYKLNVFFRLREEVYFCLVIVSRSALLEGLVVLSQTLEIPEGALLNNAYWFPLSAAAKR